MLKDIDWTKRNNKKIKTVTISERNIEKWIPQILLIIVLSVGGNEA